MERLFLAIDPPLEIKKEIYNFYKDYKYIKGIKWVKKPDNIHITLKFFGDTTEDEKSTLIKALTELCRDFSPFNICIEKSGVFPNIKLPRVVWLGIKDLGENIIKIQSATEENLFSLGFEKEGKSFAPHLTIARIGNNKDENIRNFIREILLAKIKSSDFVVNRIVLFKSILKKEGAAYEPIHFFAFNKGKDT